MAEPELDRLTLLATYRPVFVSADSPLDFYRRVRSDGASKVTAFMLLREFYRLRLSECAALAAQADGNGGSV